MIVGCSYNRKHYFIKDKWYHVAVTRSGNSFDLWVDGTKIATTVQIVVLFQMQLFQVQTVALITLELRLVHYQHMVLVENLMDIFQTYIL